MRAGHTPGPWTVSDLYADDMGHPELSIMAIVNGQVCHPAAVCLQFPRMEGMQMANARLIASAPDLLAERDRLQALNAELKKDADRYRWLASGAYEAVIPHGATLNGSRTAWITKLQPGPNFDAAIDAAIARAALDKHTKESA